METFSASKYNPSFQQYLYFSRDQYIEDFHNIMDWIVFDQFKIEKQFAWSMWVYPVVIQ